MNKTTTLCVSILLAGTIGCASGQVGNRTSQNPRKRRVLLIAIDGLRSDGLLRHAPGLRAFGENNGHTWVSKVAIPISAPSWCTIFSGLSHERTGVTNNAFTGKTLSPSGNNLAAGRAKTVFNHLRENQLNSAVVSSGTWDGIKKIAAYSNPDNPHNRRVKSNDNRTHHEYAAQMKAIEAARRYIDAPDLDLVVFYTHHVDNAGHVYGHDPDVTQYAAAIAQADKAIGPLLEHVERRQQDHDEQWLILITTDHGGSSRWKLEQSRTGLAVLAQMDADKQINAGIPQIHLEGVHGLRKDDVIDNEQTTTFIIVKQGATKRDLGAARTSRDITPTVIDFLLPGKTDILSGLDGKSLLD